MNRYAIRRGLGRSYDVVELSASGCAAYAVDSGLTLRQAEAAVRRLEKAAHAKAAARNSTVGDAA